MKAYTLMKGIKGRQGTSNAAWEAYREFGQEAKNGLPASGRNMLTLLRRDRDGERARKRFYHPLLDGLKKDRETDTKSGLAAAARKRKLAADDSGEEAETSTRHPMAAPLETIPVVFVERQKELMSGNLQWATARIKQLVPLRDLKVAEIVSGIGPRIPNGKYVRAMYGAITKPSPNGGVSEDMERITSDADLANFIEVTSGAYKPIMVQVQIITTGEEGQQTPPPDDRPYFGKDAFDTKAGRDDYDPAVSDSENELYLIKFAKKKARTWPRSDHGFEHQKARCQMRLIRMRNHLEEAKRRHKKFMRPKKGKIIDSDNDGFKWLKWLSPQDGKSYVGARAGAKAELTDYNKNKNEKVAKNIALGSFGKRGREDFNLWSDDDE